MSLSHVGSPFSWVMYTMPNMTHTVRLATTTRNNTNTPILQEQNRMQHNSIEKIISRQMSMTPVSIRKSPRLNREEPNSAAMLQLTIGGTLLSPVEVLTLGTKLATPVLKYRQKD